MANILIFGDSITYGCWDEEGGWAFRLKHAIENKVIASNFQIDHFVYPLGIPGDTTHTLLQRFKPETEARVVPQEETIFIFAIGINDSIYNTKTHNHTIPLWKSKNNLQLLIQSAKKYTNKILFVGLTPVDETNATLLSWFPECSYTNKYIQQYDKALQEICSEDKIQFIDISSEWMKMDYTKLLIDGLHPNTEGHKLLFDQIYKEITI